MIELSVHITIEYKHTLLHIQSDIINMLSTKNKSHS